MYKKGNLAMVQKANFDMLKNVAGTSGTILDLIAALKVYDPSIFGGMTGSIQRFPDISVAPTGFYVLAGQLIQRSTDAGLWAYAQSTNTLMTDAAWITANTGEHFSLGDGLTNFRLPDYRGFFDRAFDAGRTLDLSRAVGSYQADALKAHTHEIPLTIINGNFGATGSAPYPSTGTTTPSGLTGGTETRPKNIATLWCIKT